MVELTKRAQAASDRRAHILASSRQVFLDRGLVGARTRQIADAAGVKEAVLYSHFASKEEIFAAAVFEPAEREFSDLVERLASQPEVDERSRQRAFIRANENLMESVRDVVPLLGVALFSDVELGRSFFQERLLRIHREFVDLCERELEGWEGHRPLDPRIVALGSWGLMFGVVHDAALRGEELDVSTATRRMNDLRYFGLVHTRASLENRPTSGLPPVAVGVGRLRGVARVLPTASAIRQPSASKGKEPEIPARRKRLPAPDRRAQLLRVAREVFERVGREQASTHRIAEAAGVNVALLYQHFDSGDEIFDASIVAPLAALLEGRRARPFDPDLAGTPRDRLAQLCTELLQLLVEAAPTLGVAVLGDRTDGAALYRRLVVPLIDEWLVAGLRSVGAPARSFDLGMVARALFGLLLYTALTAHLLAVRVDAGAVARELSDFVYLGSFDEA